MLNSFLTYIYIHFIYVDWWQNTSLFFVCSINNTIIRTNSHYNQRIDMHVRFRLGHISCHNCKMWSDKSRVIQLVSWLSQNGHDSQYDLLNLSQWKLHPIIIFSSLMYEEVCFIIYRDILSTNNILRRVDMNMYYSNYLNNYYISNIYIYISSINSYINTSMVRETYY